MLNSVHQSLSYPVPESKVLRDENTEDEVWKDSRVFPCFDLKFDVRRYLAFCHKDESRITEFILYVYVW